MRPRSCHALSACLPPCFACALELCSLSFVRRPPHAPSLATPPLPFSACSRSSRACSRCYRVFLRSRVLPRAFASCCCAALSHAPISSRAPPLPLLVQAPCRTRDVAPLASGVAAVHVRFCTTAAVLLRSGCSLLAHPPARAHPDASPRTLRRPSCDFWHSRSLHLRVPWLFMCSLLCWRSALARQLRLRPLLRPRERPRALHRLAISAAAALRSSAPLARTVLAALH